MKMSREWAMPTHETFTCPPIKHFVERWLDGAKIVVDPFARDSKYGTITNDLNHDTSAQYHLTALEFLARMRQDGVKADVVIFDPPYSLRQIKECYDSIGRGLTMDETQNGGWAAEKEIISDLLKIDGVFLNFGWSTNGLGKNRESSIEEILLVAHGRAHNDTICMAERKIQHQERIF